MGISELYGTIVNDITATSASSARAGAKPNAQRAPSRKLGHQPVCDGGGTSEGQWMRVSANSTNRNDAALMPKHTASLVTASSMPATAGPMTRAALTIIELSAIALARSARSSTNITYDDCRSTTSKVCATDRNSASAIRCHTWTTPSAVIAVSVTAC